MAPTKRDIVIFDLGGVLIEWNPRHLYRKLFAGDEAAMEHFLANVCTHEWNRGQDAGRTFAEGAVLAAEWVLGKQGFYEFKDIFDQL